MTKCANCGAEMGYGAFCPDCGSAADAYASQPQGQPVMQQPVQQAGAQQTVQQGGRGNCAMAGFPLKPDTGSVWWAVLSFFIPQAGIILWAIWRDYKPNDARKCGIGVIIWAALMIIPLIFCLITLFGVIATGSLIGLSAAGSSSLY